jgi:hypothetical protein
MSHETNHVTAGEANRALRVGEAGRLLADLLGREQAFSNQLVWRLVRKDQLPCVKIGRRMWFRSVDLKAFVERGGSV